MASFKAVQVLSRGVDPAQLPEPQSPGAKLAAALYAVPDGPDGGER